MKRFFLSLAMAGTLLPALAHTDLINQDFSGEWKQDITIFSLATQQTPHSSINAIFMDGNGVTQPWWPAKDSSQGDRYMATYSIFATPGQADSWLVLRPITVTSTGFNLSFGAQSLPIRSGDEHALSSLKVFISENPITKESQPEAPALELVDIPYGESRDNCEGDFLPFDLNLDPWEGKTIYIAFANQNDDKDLLCIDDILVRRLDNAEMNVTAPEYILAGEFNVDVEIKGTTGEGLKNWKLAFECGDVKDEESGESISAGDSKAFSFKGTALANEPQTYTLTLSSDDAAPIVYSGTVTGMTFQPTRRIFVEETTGTWCGNCPLAICTMEYLESLEEFEGRILPVAVHVGNDPMVNDNYSYMFGLGSTAPFARVDRYDELIGFAPLDMAPDVSNDKSAAHAIAAHLDAVTLLDVEVAGTYVKEGDKIVGIDATATIIPAVDLNGYDYNIGFVLTENNVAPAGKNSTWYQHNYLSGEEIALNAGNAWGSLPGSLGAYVRYQDVAREIYDFYGLEGSVPEKTLKAGEKVEFSTRLAMPEFKSPKYQGTMNPENLYLTAFVIERHKTIGQIMNANRTALGENPEPRRTSDDFLKEYTTVEEIDAADSNKPAEYFNLQGMRVENPTPGIYVVRRGDKISKVVIR